MFSGPQELKKSDFLFVGEMASEGLLTFILKQLMCTSGEMTDISLVK